ncbi:Hypothetical predicted protein [Paramuricea clavata]|uniref:Uncharacterized protein n=1 Tax=Paramuricea clavata TaxID=317549 RepID=A0A6S7IQC8_PARCT|nr:Hypothetical predicted protein [Paramuricea clavata]
MDDVRIEWIRNEVYLALEIADTDVFEDLLNRDDEPEIPVIPDGDELLEGEGSSINELGEPLMNGTMQPDEILVNGDLNGEVNPETGEAIQEEKPADENEEDAAGKFKFTPVTVSSDNYPSFLSSSSFKSALITVKCNNQ